MGFIMMEPLRTSLADKTSNMGVLKHVWHELDMLQFGQHGQDAKPWLEQARYYHIDASNSDWRSAGLLYYYSFLNLTKALLVRKEAISANDLVSTSTFHGLATKSQSPTDLREFKITIFPPGNAASGRNLFALLCESLTGKAWPFDSKIEIQLGEVLGYCADITDELKTLYDLDSSLIPVQSLFRISEGSAWFEMLLRKEKAATLAVELSGLKLTTVDPEKAAGGDDLDWLFSHHRTRASFADHVFLRTPERKIQDGPESQYSAISAIIAELNEHLSPFAEPPVWSARDQVFWYFVPKMKLSGMTLHWHPLLSDYLVSFALSDILRYRPHLVSQGRPDYFLSESWCRQSPLTMARYFLLAATSPAVRVRSIS